MLLHCRLKNFRPSGSFADEREALLFTILTVLTSQSYAKKY
jgi:hypothetical protein